MRTLPVLHLLFLFVMLNSPGLSLTAQTQVQGKPLPPGYPDRSASLDVLPGFRNPPPGYGEVSFYWWLGDTLTKERITWQLDQLAGKSITGLQVNYAHSDEGGNIWGLTYPGKPGLFTREWWDLFSWFLQEAKKRNMSVSLSDYTLGIAGQGWFVDEMIKENPELYGSKLVSGIYDLRPGLDTVIQVPDHFLSAKTFRIRNGKLLPVKAGEPVSPGRPGEFKWNANPDTCRLVMVYSETVKTSFDPMNPLSGKKVIEKFFEPFEEHCPGEAGKGLNFFFSDELNFGISGLLWNDRFAGEFLKRKGYEIIPELPDLFIQAGPVSSKIRMDFNDVLVALSEESFFKPIYNWHTDRGMLYGCDHGGRGLDVTEFGDYFRAQRWMSGPGCDQPVLSRNVNKNKVASSIAHLYERPRTWLEGYHSSGWGTSSAQVADATFTNFAMGQNLLSLHGLYYSTHGGWWEWAPPDNHFRQPYWADMDQFLKCSERLSYVLSQGYHRCDVAILYPVTPVVAGMGGEQAVSMAFAAGEKLYKSGIDYDFIDFESLIRARMKDGEIQVSGENYKVLILPGMTAIHYRALEKVVAFYRAGGIVIALGSLPEASERIGGEDPEIQQMNSAIFGAGSGEITKSGKRSFNHVSPKAGFGIYLDKPDRISEEIGHLITRDFKVLATVNQPYILHRKAGTRDIYYVYGVPRDTVCYFRSSGRVELWNPWDGSVSELPVISSDKVGTRLKMPLTESEPQLIVFSQGTPARDANDMPVRSPNEVLLVGDWEFELKPTLDNQWGDYRQPAYPGYVSTDATRIRYKMESAPDPGWQAAGLDYSQWDLVQPSYGPEMWKLGPLPGQSDSVLLESKLAGLKSIDPSKPVEVGGKAYYWAPYEFSWRWGLKGNPGRQGYHGLKEWMHDDIFQLGNAVRDWPGVPRPRYEASGEGGTCFLWSTVSSAGEQPAKVVAGGIQPTGMWINGQPAGTPTGNIPLRTGANTVLLRYSAPGTAYLVFEKADANPSWKQLIPLASGWYKNPAVLPFDPYPGLSNPAGWYRFKAPPGLESIEIAMNRKPDVWVNGRLVQVRSNQPVKGLYADPNQKSWKAELPAAVPAAASVAVRASLDPGFYGGAACPEPIRLNCDKGVIRTGDLSGNESLMTYSGGMWYRKTIVLTAAQAASHRVVIDLGDLVASAEVSINGKPAGKRLTPPWQFDLTGKIQAGGNRLEILIYNTLGNYYLTTPSQYVGPVKSGLIGPVRLLIYDQP